MTKILNFNLLLTEKEKIIVNHMFDCLTRKMMAIKEGLSIATINAHHDSIFKKLGVNRVALVTKMIEKKF